MRDEATVEAEWKVSSLMKQGTFSAGGIECIECRMIQDIQGVLAAKVVRPIVCRAFETWWSRPQMPISVHELRCRPIAIQPQGFGASAAHWNGQALLKEKNEL